MPIAPFTRRQVLSATTTFPWTTDFRHLLPIPRFWLRRSTVRDPVIKSVKPRDRIKYWNIVPGDQVRLLGDKANTLHEVLSINRMSNRVFVKGASGDSDTKRVPTSKNYHYARCQLFLGNYELPASRDSSGPKVVPVFAKRLGTSSPVWNSFLKRYDWSRFATCTEPVIPYQKGEKISVPWPKYEKPPLPEPDEVAAGEYDTPKDVVAQATYRPPSFVQSLDGPIPRPPSEEDFLSILYNPHRQAGFDESAPVETFLHRELSNPHGTAKKLARWKSYQTYKQHLLKQYIEEEYKNLNGRPQREARAEAAYRWRAKLEEEKDADRKRRWKHKAAEAHAERKVKRKARKVFQMRNRLTELVLKDEPNQVIPNRA
ncbi:hypothetical protein BDN72DRAFT_762408 [Pluteus cervinus]|uniref:Uncharacterized protein n=1 Tax=Pluteus cervinus TaxID=181527 RepID=A0ACD3B5X2_9AGAR|nr:hypothetical protein BDN72DRAFT_762408 [Pluteus cervinus]